jgi:predicted ArsR family transcriptional regulator
VIIGPLSSARRISYSDAPNEQISRLSDRASISPLYVSKIISVLNQKGSDTLSSEELAFYLGITTRSASRILAKLEAGGVAVAQQRRQLNLRGRPSKIYKIDFTDPA